jgi:hypothetical protein
MTGVVPEACFLSSRVHGQGQQGGMRSGSSPFPPDMLMPGGSRRGRLSHRRPFPDILAGMGKGNKAVIPAHETGLVSPAPIRESSQSPVTPSIRSRSRSACPLCRAYSSIMWR